MATGKHKKTGRPPIPGVPQRIFGGKTPIVPTSIDGPPEAGSPPHLDIEATLREMHWTMQLVQAQVEKGSSSSSESLKDDEFITSVAKSVAGKNKFGKILMWLVGILGTAFSAGMAWSLFIGANATDSEVHDAVKELSISHNGGRDPDSVGIDGKIIGHHPEMREAISELQEDTKQVKSDVSTIKEAQKRSDKRSEYQYEFSRWQGEILECERKSNCKPPKKPQVLKNLEAEIHLGKF